MPYFLGVDGGGTKTHAIIADQSGRAVAASIGGPGSWEAVGYQELAQVLQNVTADAVTKAGIKLEDIAGAGFGLAGYDWPSQQQAHMQAVQSTGLACPLKVVNDAILGIVGGSPDGWGLSLVSGTGCNCRGWTRDRQQDGRVVGGASYWSGEAAGAFDIILRAMRAVAFQWNRRGPQTALTPLFLHHTGAQDLDDLVEGLYLNRYRLDGSLVRGVFEVAHQGDQPALEVIRWAGEQLGQMAWGVIHQLELEAEIFDVVLIGSLFDGHPLLSESLSAAVWQVAPKARFVRLKAPPVLGAVLLGMEAGGLEAGTPEAKTCRDLLIESIPASLA
jgi:N-acetylglucosamine kinase-like BadF-type ATPase